MQQPSYINAPSIKERVGGPVGAFAKEGAFSISLLADSIVESYDQARALSTGTDTIKIKDARKIYSQANDQIKELNNNIDKGGKISKADIDNAFRIAYQSTAEIEATAKRKSIDNARYKFRSGTALLEESKANYIALNNLYIEVMASYNNRNAQIAQAQQIRQSINI